MAVSVALAWTEARTTAEAVTREPTRATLVVTIQVTRCQASAVPTIDTVGQTAAWAATWVVVC